MQTPLFTPAVSQTSGAEQVPALAVSPVPLAGSAPPPFPETLEGGLKRYGRALQRLAWAFPGRNILVVSHGEVGCSCKCICVYCDC